MNLRQYLFMQDMRAASFARKIDYHRNYISMVIRGHYKPGRKFREKVHEATAGEVHKDLDWGPPIVN